MARALIQPDYLRRPKTLQIRNQLRYFGFDVETKDSNKGFLLASIVRDDFQKTFYDQDDLIHFFENSPKACYVATNLEFDALAAFKKDYRLYPLKPVYRAGRMIMASCNSAKFTDTMNYWPASVERLGEFLNIPKMKKPDFSRAPKTEAELDYMRRYNIQDAYITFKFWEYLDHSLQALGGRIRATIASASMELYRRKYLPLSLRKTPIKWQADIRKAYYGGRTEAFMRGTLNTRGYKLYDINSLYPSVMAGNPYPYPNRIRHVDQVRPYQYQEMEGVAFASIDSPDIYLPFLPRRDNGRLTFPVGSWKGWYTFPELRHAETLGYHIKLHEGYVSNKSIRPFDMFVHDLYELRKKYKAEGNPIEKVIKLVLNSCYGKFGMLTETETISYIPELDNDEFIRLSGEGSRTMHDYLFTKRTMTDRETPPYSIPMLSAYITSYARIKLYKLLQKSQAIYCDTDSIITRHAQEESSGLGALKLEKTIKEGIIVRPKFYLANDEVRLKGLRHADADTFRKILEGSEIMRQKYAKFRESLIHGSYYNQPVPVTKKFDLEDVKRSWAFRFDPQILEDSEPLCTT